MGLAYLTRDLCSSRFGSVVDMGFFFWELIIFLGDWGFVLGGKWDLSFLNSENSVGEIN
jgi:hypothetical protein